MAGRAGHLTECLRGKRAAVIVRVLVIKINASSCLKIMIKVNDATESEIALNNAVHEQMGTTAKSIDVLKMRFW